MNPSPILFNPPSPQSTKTHQFRSYLNQQFDIKLDSYHHLWQWSIDNRSSFWNAVWDFTKVVGEKGKGPFVDENATPAENPLWFPNATVNWAQNALQCRSKEKIALIQASMSKVRVTDSNRLTAFPRLHSGTILHRSVSTF